MATLLDYYEKSQLYGSGDGTHNISRKIQIFRDSKNSTEDATFPLSHDPEISAKKNAH